MQLTQFIFLDDERLWNPERVCQQQQHISQLVDGHAALDVQSCDPRRLGNVLRRKTTT